MEKVLNKDWRQTTLGEVAAIDWGNTHLTKRAYSTGGTYLGVSAAGPDGRMDHAEHKAGVTVVSAIGEYCGRVFQPREDFTAIKNTMTVTAKAGLADQSFLYYLLSRNSIPRRGSSQPFLSKGDTQNWSILLPTIEEQSSIAVVLSSFDNKIELLCAQNKTLEEMAQRLFKEWFVDFNFPGSDGRSYSASGGKMVESEYGEIPEEWQTRSYADLVNVLSGGTPKTDVPEYWNGQIPFFTPKDAKDTFYVDETEKYITEAGLSACNSKLYPKDTVFITARGTVGKCALALRDMAMNQSCYALVGKDISNLFVFLLTKQLIDVIKKSASGAVFDAITVSTFHSLNVVLGDRGVTDHFETLIRPMFNKIANNTNEIQKLSELRDQLLPKLMSGEIAIDRP